MWKALVLGFSATTNMILIGVGGAVLGASALAAKQAIARGRQAQQPAQPVGPVGMGSRNG